MPSIIGNIKVLSVGGAGEVQLGDCLQNSPESTSKSYIGAGSGNTGDLCSTYNLISTTNTLDQDLADSNQTTQAGNRGVL